MTVSSIILHRIAGADLSSSNANNIARVANSQLTSSDEKLHPLVSLKTGKPIEKFPGTSKEIEKLTCMLDVDVCPHDGG